MGKPRIIKDYEKLDKNIILQIKLKYPYGYEKSLITFKNAKKQLISALPFESTDYYYLVKMTRVQAQNIILNDSDFDENGELKSVSRMEIEKELEKAGVSLEMAIDEK